MIQSQLINRESYFFDIYFKSKIMIYFDKPRGYSSGKSVIIPVEMLKLACSICKFEYDCISFWKFAGHS